MGSANNCVLHSNHLMDQQMIYFKISWFVATIMNKNFIFQKNALMQVRAILLQV